MELYQFQTQTGSTGHLATRASSFRMSKVSVSNPNGLHRPFSPGCGGGPKQYPDSFKPQRAPKDIYPTTSSPHTTTTLTVSNPKGPHVPFSHSKRQTRLLKA